MKIAFAILFSFLLMLGMGVVPSAPAAGAVAMPAACYDADEPPCCLKCRCCIAPASDRAGLPLQPVAPGTAAQDTRYQHIIGAISLITVPVPPPVSPLSSLPCPADFPPSVPLFQRHCLLLI